MSKHNGLTRRRVLGAGAAAAGLAGLPFKALAATDINYWHHFTSQTEIAGMVEIMRLFQAANPDVSVTQENIPNADYMAKFTSAVIANSRPDTAMVSPERLPDMVAMNGLVDLSDRVASWDKKDFYSDDAWEGIDIDGKIYGVPAFSFVYWTYYRKDWFEEAGIESPPDTFEEMIEAAIKITDPSKGRYGFSLRGGAGGQSSFIDVFDSFGGFIYEGSSVEMDIPKAVAAVRFYSDLFTKYKVAQPSAPADSYRQMMEGFRTGQTGMVWHHTGSLTEILGALSPDQVGTALRPAGPHTRIARVKYQYNGVSNDQSLDQSWDWTSYWGDVDAAIALLEATGYFPATSEVSNDPRITSNPLYQAALDTLKIGAPTPKVVGFDGWSRNSMMSEFQKVLIGNSTPEEAVDAMARTLDRETG
jgi:multiple sugar transport system substrate-binding protein